MKADACRTLALTYLLITGLPVAASATAATESVGKSMTQVEVQWQAEPDAESYQIEVQTKAGRAVKKFTSKQALFRFRAKPGRYQIRAQTKTSEGRLGLWTDWVDVNVPPKRVDSQSIERKIEAVAQGDTLLAPVPLAWTSSGAATRYQVNIIDGLGKMVTSFVSDKSEALLQLPPGTYSVEIVSIAEDGLRSKPTKLENYIHIAAATLPTPSVRSQLDISGQLKALDFDSKPGLQYMVRTEHCLLLSDEWKVIASQPLTAASWSPPANLAPGKYRVGFWSEAPGWQNSALQHWEFLVKPKLADLN